MQESMNALMNGRNFYLKRSLLKVVGSEFYIYDQAGGLVALAHQKGFKLKEEINIFADKEKTKCILEIRARQVIDFSASYDIYDTASQTRIGVLQRKGWNALVRDEWLVKDANELQIAQVIEDSLPLALLRRLLSNLIPQNYDLLVNGARVVDFRQNFNPFSYHLNVIIEQPFDPRMAIATAVMLAAIEGRQRG
jgi:hypothetical protein